MGTVFAEPGTRDALPCKRAALPLRLWGIPASSQPPHHEERSSPHQQGPVELVGFSPRSRAGLQAVKSAMCAVTSCLGWLRRVNVAGFEPAGKVAPGDEVLPAVPSSE